MYRPVGRDRRQSRRAFLRASLALTGLSLLSGCGLTVPGTSTAPQLRRVGFLNNSAWAVDAFRDGMRDLGYVEGQNLAIELRGSSDNSLYGGFTEELVSLGVECMVIGAINSASAAKQANSAVPMVAVLSNFDAVETGLVMNIARPEANITGVAGVPGNALQWKLPELLKDAIPGARRIGILANANQFFTEVTIDGMKAAAQQAGQQSEVAVVPDLAGVEPAFAAFQRSGVQAVVIVNQNTFSNASRQIAALALQYGLPAITTDMGYPSAGGFMAYGIDRIDSFRHAATYVDKLLKGAKPADLPMERPRRYEMVINLRTAQALGLTIPQTVLAQANELIR